MADNKKNATYDWPRVPLNAQMGWNDESPLFQSLPMPETLDSLNKDSRWPAFFSSPMCLVSTGHGEDALLEKVVGPSIVNRFPYIIALSFCSQKLSNRHYIRSGFMDMIENCREVSVQFLNPGDQLDQLIDSLSNTDANEAFKVSESKASVRAGITVNAEAISDAYMVYEGKLVKPDTDFDGTEIFTKPYTDIGSHRIYYFEVTAIQLREDIANGETQISWRALADWMPSEDIVKRTLNLVGDRYEHDGYTKSFTPNYFFPSKGTIGFTEDGFRDGMAYKVLPPLPVDQVEVDNDKARWPCFFPSSLGIITTYNDAGAANIMPCGSTTIVSRHPFTVAICVSYAQINERYAARASLDFIRKQGHFGCGVGYIDDAVTEAILFTGTISMSDYPNKANECGLKIEKRKLAPLISALPIHFECEVIMEQKLGTHVMFFGEVKNILVRKDVNVDRPLKWRPWPELIS
ncbi:flavin reductase family protein [Rhodospirillales bacterium]|nr:flavin reductase family protein [Rhodospirillales bacterium]